MTEVLTVGALAKELLARWMLLAACVLVGLGMGLTYAITTPDAYTSTAVLVVMSGAPDEDGYYQAAQLAEKRAAMYPTLLASPQVVDRTRTELGLDIPTAALRSRLSATNTTETPLIEVSATAESPDLARRMADSAAGFLADYAIALEKKGSGNSEVSVQKAVPAAVPTAPSTPSPLVLGGLGLLAGLAAGVGLVLLLRAQSSFRRGRQSPLPVVSPSPDPHAQAEPTTAPLPAPPPGNAVDATGPEPEGVDEVSPAAGHRKPSPVRLATQAGRVIGTPASTGPTKAAAAAGSAKGAEATGSTKAAGSPGSRKDAGSPNAAEATGAADAAKPAKSPAPAEGGATKATAAERDTGAAEETGGMKKTTEAAPSGGPPGRRDLELLTRPKAQKSVEDAHTEALDAQGASRPKTALMALASAEDTDAPDARKRVGGD